MRATLTITVLAVLVVGCVARPSATDRAKADYGYKISQQECERIVRDYYNMTLKDPESARFQFGQCGKGWLDGNVIGGRPVAYGYVMGGWVNAKNSFGGYGGRIRFSAAIKNGVLRRLDHGRTSTYWNSNGQIYRWD